MAYLRGVIVAVGVLVSSSIFNAATLTVDLNGGADYTDIQPAIDAAKDGDTVIVKPGEYVIAEPINFNRLHDPENPASPPVKNITVRSEAGAEVTTIRLAEIPINPERASVVIFESGESPESILDGFSVTGGRGTRWNGLGGGVYVTNSSRPTARNCFITNNNAGVGGALFCASESTVILKACDLTKNTAIWGGAIELENSRLSLIGCNLRQNVAWDFAGAICCAYGSVLCLTNTKLIGNYAKRYSGGIHCSMYSSQTVVNCVFEGNEVTEGVGGAAYCASIYGTSFANCVFSKNKARDEGAGLYVWWSEPRLINCIFSEHGAKTVYCFGSRSAHFAACLFWDPDLLIREKFQETLCGTLVNCVVGVDPKFSGEVPHEYKLQSDSPAIDAGTSAGAPTTDIEGHGRPCGTGMDIGAYESGDCVSPGCGDPNGDEDLDGIKNGSEDLNRDGICATDDTDSDGIPNILDSDDDGDGVRTRLEDLNGNGDPSDDDGNGNGRPAYLDPSEKTVPGRFKRGDANADSTTDISDAIGILSFLFTGGKAPPCQKAADITDDGTLDISDGVALLSHLFLGGKAPPEPFAECGIDPTTDELTCESFTLCH
jgi:hypothetical protein